MKQREMFLLLISRYGKDQERVCAAYAKAERDGKVARKSNKNNISPDKYADNLWRDYKVKNGWK
jgi:hypothetical protein